VGIGGRAYWVGSAHFLVLKAKPYWLPYHFLLFQNKKSATSVYETRFASALLFALHSNEPNLLSPDAFYDLKMHKNEFVVGMCRGSCWGTFLYTVL